MKTTMKKQIKNILEYLPLKKQLFMFLRLFNPPEKWFRHLHFKGIIKIKTATKRTFRMHHYGFQLENEIFWKGIYDGWEKESMKLWTQLVKQATSIADIGANTGVFSLIAANESPGAYIIAFEPVERVFEKMKANFALNSFTIQCEQLAVSNSTGESIIYDLPTEHVYSVSVNRNLAPGQETRQVPIQTVRLDDYIQQHQLKKIDLIKIDVEYHEPEVLEGFSEYLEKFRPTMIIEVLTDEIGNKIQACVEDKGYLFFDIDEINGPKQRQNISKSTHFNYLLCSLEVAKSLHLL